MQAFARILEGVMHVPAPANPHASGVFTCSDGDLSSRPGLPKICAMLARRLPWSKGLGLKVWGEDVPGRGYVLGS